MGRLSLTPWGCRPAASTAQDGCTHRGSQQWGGQGSLHLWLALCYCYLLVAGQQATTEKPPFQRSKRDLSHFSSLFPTIWEVKTLVPCSVWTAGSTPSWLTPSSTVQTQLWCWYSAQYFIYKPRKYVTACCARLCHTFQASLDDRSLQQTAEQMDRATKKKKRKSFAMSPLIWLNLSFLNIAFRKVTNNW